MAVRINTAAFQLDCHYEDYGHKWGKCRHGCTMVTISTHPASSPTRHIQHGSMSAASGNLASNAQSKTGGCLKYHPRGEELIELAKMLLEKAEALTKTRAPGSHSVAAQHVSMQVGGKHGIESKCVSMILSMCPKSKGFAHATEAVLAQVRGSGLGIRSCW